MKMSFGKRFLLFAYWLASLLVLAALLLPEYLKIAMDYVGALIPADYISIIAIALLAIYLLMSIAVLCLVFKREKNRADRGFITVDSADTGKVRIAIPAIEQMVKQAAYTVDGVADMKIAIKNDDDAVAIQVNVTMVSGSHVPTVTLNMQRAIRQYVEMNCGVAVRSVSVSIQSVATPSEGGKKHKRSDAKPAAAPAQEVYKPEFVPAAAEEPVAPAVVAPVTEPVYAAEPAVETIEEYAAPVEVSEEPVVEIADSEEPIEKEEN